MKPFVSQFALLMLSSLGVYGLMLSITLICMPPPQRIQGMDTGRASHTLFATEPKYVFLGRGGLSSVRTKVLILGASNVVVGFKQDQLQGLIRGAEVNNLSVGGSNVTQLRQIVDLVHEVQSPEARHHNIFVIGLWFGLFVDDHRRWNTPDRHAGDTDIDIERYRYGFSRRTSGHPVAVLPPEWLDMGVLIIHPYLVIDKILRDMAKALRRIGDSDVKRIDGTGLNAKTVSEQDKLRYLAFWNDYIGTSKLSDDQFDALEALIGQIAATGGRVVVVDLPLPPWHAQRSPYQAEYRQRIRQLFIALEKHSGVSVMEIQRGSADEDFSDEVHPKPNVAANWTRQLATVLRRQIGEGGLVAKSAMPDGRLHVAVPGVVTAIR